MDLMAQTGAALQELRKRRPLIHHLTNYVTMTDCANATLAIGASPVMTCAMEEVQEMASAASALVLNTGTIQVDMLEVMLVAGQTAAQKNIPIVLDPVGAGGTRLRTESVQKLLEELPIAIVRGNLSEISSLAENAVGVNSGVDNHASQELTIDLALRLAESLGTVVAITGPIDAVSDGKRAVLLGNGVPMLSYVTGTGCMTTSLTASFASVAEPFLAAVAGISSMSIAGELALAAPGGSDGPGTFHTKIFDGLYQLSDAIYTSYGKVLTYHE